MPPCQADFNPHEREARDLMLLVDFFTAPILIHTSVKLVTLRVEFFIKDRQHFNPHEREARDHLWSLTWGEVDILIHTSVKLVTFYLPFIVCNIVILIHTSVKLVTYRRIQFTSS